MLNFSEELNQEQLEVIHNGDGPCLVLAGAGSGKTRTITYRVAYLMEHGTAPDNILLLTFTNKAAKEMTDRVSQLTGGKIKLPWSGTFHRIAYTILRRYSPLLGYKNNFSILDSEDSRDMLKICIKQEGVDRKEHRFPSPNVIQSIISYGRNAKITIKEVLEQKYPNWVDLDEVLSGTIDKVLEVHNYEIN
jgi:DNA helicase-2/ATP-dependent DNA helicase PcrA